MPDFSAPYTYGDDADGNRGITVVDAELSSDDDEWVIERLTEDFFEEVDLTKSQEVSWSGDEGDFDFDVYPAEYGAELMFSIKEEYEPEDDEEGDVAKKILALEAHIRAEEARWDAERKAKAAEKARREREAKAAREAELDASERILIGSSE